MSNYCKCYKCNKEINKERVIGEWPLEDNTEVICGACIKLEYGEDSFNFWKKVAAPRKDLLKEREQIAAAAERDDDDTE